MAHISARSVFISDVHLGSKDCKADYLLSMLNHLQTERLYLVGDIIDVWALKKQVYWPASHHAVLKKIMQLADQGVDVIYIPGNHDEDFRHYQQQVIANVAIQSQAEFVSVTGKRFLVVHGDIFDRAVSHGKWLMKLGDWGYDLLLWLNRVYNRFGRLFGRRYWSLASYLKSKVPHANDAIARYRQAALHEVQRRGLDGIICGHIHHPEIIEQDGLQYLNDGDWLEHCSALYEDHDGQMQMLYWTENRTLALTNKSRPVTANAA